MIPTDAADRIEAMLAEASETERAAKFSRDGMRTVNLLQEVYQLRYEAERFPIPCDGEV